MNLKKERGSSHVNGYDKEHGKGMRKVLILGGSGMLGHTLFRSLSEDSRLDVYATVRSAKELSVAMGISKAM